LRISKFDVRGRGCGSADDLREKAMQLAEVALRGGLLVAAVRCYGSLMCMPERMCERRLLSEQQTHYANELKNGPLHRCLISEPTPAMNACTTAADYASIVKPGKETLIAWTPQTNARMRAHGILTG
jgi:hypothetical protein